MSGSWATRSPNERTCYECWRPVGPHGFCRCGCVVTFRGEHPRVQPWEIDPPRLENEGQ